MRSSTAFCVAVLAWQLRAACVAAPICEHTSGFAEKQIAGATISFYAKVIAAEEDAQHRQRLSFQVLNSWKGPYQEQTVVTTIVAVTRVCGGLGCVFPFKIGDIALVLTPASAPYSAPDVSKGVLDTSGHCYKPRTDIALDLRWLRGPNMRWSGRAVNKLPNLSLCVTGLMMLCRAAQLHR